MQNLAERPLALCGNRAAVRFECLFKDAQSVFRSTGLEKKRQRDSLETARTAGSCGRAVARKASALFPASLPLFLGYGEWHETGLDFPRDLW